MARSSWTGTLSLGLGVIPVKAYPYATSSRRKGFKNLCDCHGQPIVQRNHCPVTDNVVLTVAKGAEAGKAIVKVADANVGEVEATKALEIELVTPRTAVPLYSTTGSYALVPDTGGESGASKLWQALQASDHALMSRWVKRAGGKDVAIAIYAGPKGLIASELPHGEALNTPPEPDLTIYTAAPAELALMEQALTQLYPTGAYDPTGFVSHSDERRKKAIEAALSGAPAPAPSNEPAATAVPDLMAALEASLAAVKPKEAIAA
jgi:non-homologous end joining protein Ku